MNTLPFNNVDCGDCNIDNMGLNRAYLSLGVSWIFGGSTMEDHSNEYQENEYERGSWSS